MNRIVYQLSLLFALFIMTSVHAVQVTPTQNGLEIKTDQFGTQTLGYPILETTDKAKLRPSKIDLDGKRTRISYPGGSGLVIVQNGGNFNYQFQDLADNVKSLRLEMNLPVTLGKDGVEWDIANSKSKPYPVDAKDDPFLYKGNARTFAMRKGTDGYVLNIEHGYQQLQDNRKWNDQKIAWFAATQMPRVDGNKAYYTIFFTTLDGKPLAGDAQQSAEAKPEPKVLESQAKTTQAQGVETKLTNDGVMIDLHSAGQFTVQYPKLVGLKPDKPTKVDNISGTLTKLEYVDGVTAEVKLDSHRNVKVIYNNLPASVKNVRVEMPISINMSKGGKFAVGDSSDKMFPAEKQSSAFLYQGNNSKITLTCPTGPGFQLNMPSYGFQQLQDNRHWNWSTYWWWYSTPDISGKSNYSFEFKVGDLPGGAVKAQVVVDKFGQWVASDFPIKVHSEEELKKDAIEDEKYYGSLTPPTRDTFGGIPGTKEKYNLKATGFFHLGKVNGNDVLVTPEGNAFFQLGVCGLTPCDDYTLVRGREEIYEWIPSQNDPVFKSAWRPNDRGVFSYLLANRIRKTGKPYNELEHVDTWVSRELKWGFNSLGAFCPTSGPVRDVLGKHNYPFVNSLPLGKLKHIPGPRLVWDPYEPGTDEKIDQLIKHYASIYANDPLLIGAFVTNEPTIEDAPKVIPLLKASEWACKARLVSMLKDKYATIADFNKAWDINASSFDQIGDMPLKITTREASEDVHTYFAEFLNRRYKPVYDAFRKYMPNHLLIGERLQPGTASSEQLINISCKYFDILSVNYYTDGIDQNYLQRLRDWSGGKPMILSEFYYTSPDESGQQGGRAMATQDLRGQAYRNYVEQAASSGYVVGIQWFLSYDQSVTGRFFSGFNGEANNTGLINVADRPYKDMLKHMMETNYDIFSVIDGSRKPFVIDDPRFTRKSGGTKKMVTISELTESFVLDGNRSEWPGTPPYRIAQGNVKIEGTFRVAWDKDNLYFYADVIDDTPMINKGQNGGIWNGDAVELFIGHEQLDKVGNMIFSDRQILIRGAVVKEGQNKMWLANAPAQAPMDSIVVPHVDGKGYSVEAVIPFKSLGFEPKVNQSLIFDVALDNCVEERAPRTEQILYNGDKNASRDRSVWGQAKFVK